MNIIVDIPTLNIPLALLPVPLPEVTPEIWYVIIIVPLQLSDTDDVGIL